MEQKRNVDFEFAFQSKTATGSTPERAAHSFFFPKLRSLPRFPTTAFEERCIAFLARGDAKHPELVNNHKRLAHTERYGHSE